MRVIANVSPEFGYTDFEMQAVLRVHLDIAVTTKEKQFTIVIRNNLHLDNFSVNAPFNFKRQFARLVDFSAWRVNTCSDYVSLIRRDTDALACYFKVQILDKIDLVPVF